MKRIAAAVSLALCAMLVIARVPPTTGFILPRRLGWTFFKLAIKAQQTPAVFAAVYWLSLGLILAPFLFSLWRLVQMLRPLKRREILVRLLGVAVLSGAAYFALRLILDVAQNVWGVPESLNILTLLGVALAFFLLGTAFLRLAFLWAKQGRSPRLLGLTGGFLAAVLFFYGFAAWRYDINKKNLAAAVGLSAEAEETKILVVLMQGNRGAPKQEAHSMAVYTEASLKAFEEYLTRGPRVFSRQAARRLYEGYLLRMDAAGLRKTLFAAHRWGDALAWLLLLDNLVHAPGEPPPLELLDALADEKNYRIGARGALMLSAAYAHFNAKDKAAYWAQGASQGEGAAAAGLLPASKKNRFEGVVLGSVLGASRVRVGLYSHRNPQAPYSLGPAELVDSTVTNRKGNFQFTDLPAGDYFLALSINPSKRLKAEKIVVRGHRGDIHVTAQRPLAMLPPLVIRY